MAQAQLAQATCPGCKGVLHIPFDWLDRPIRCKSCGTVMKARGAAPAPDLSPAMPTPPASRPLARATPPPVLARPTPPPVLLPTPPPITPAVPLSAPTQVADTTSHLGFDFEEPTSFEPPAPSGRRRRSRKKGGSWLILAVFAGLILTLGVSGILFKDRIIAGFQIVRTGQPPASDEEKGTGLAGASKTKPVNPGSATFPRRALIISVHNYLYANPIVDAPAPTPNIASLVRALGNGLKIPLTQIVHVSDQAAKNPVPPLKSVIEEGITNFVNTCRKQDRIMLVFIGHTREIDNKPYLVPLEGEFDNVETLIELDWVYKQLASCPARQKILVIDGNRRNSAQGEERPGSGPLGPKFEAMLKAPPAGVQVLAACSAGQQSEELGRSSLGVFLDSLRLALSPEKGAKGALDGTIQKHGDLIPVVVISRKLTTVMAEQLDRVKIKQTALVAGSVPASGADFDPTEKAADAPAIPVVRTGDVRLVKDIMNDISLPPLKGGEANSSDVSFANLPPFPPERLKPFEGGQLPADSVVRKAVHEARVTLWAISTASVPADIKNEVQELRKKLGVDLSVMRDQYNYPGEGPAELRFRDRVFEDSKAISRVVLKLETVLDKLSSEALKEAVGEAPKRWQANYAFVLARFNAQMAYLEEYNGLLGQMRKPGVFPDGFDAKIHNAFRMASREKPGDTLGKKYDKAARAAYKKLIDKNEKTPWAVLAKREMLTALGLDWQPF